MKCEFCGRKLRPDEGKVCRFCAGKIKKALDRAEAEARALYQAHAESYGHLSSNPNDHPSI